MEDLSSTEDHAVQGGDMNAGLRALLKEIADQYGASEMMVMESGQSYRTLHAEIGPA